MLLKRREELQTVAEVLRNSKKRSERALGEKINSLVADAAYDLVTPYEVQLRREYIIDRVYALLLNKIDKESRDIVFNYGCEITELGIDIYKSTKKNWYVDGSSASKVAHLRDGYGHYNAPEYSIPRTEEGYVLTDDLELTPEQTEEAKQFLYDYSFILGRLHDISEQRNAVLNGGYGLRNDEDAELVDSIVTLLGYKAAYKGKHIKK